MSEQPEDVSYTIPKSSSAWDDTELIAAWNAQLARINEGHAPGSEISEDDSDATTGDEEEDVKSTDEESEVDSPTCNANSSSATEYERTGPQKRQREADDSGKVLLEEALMPPFPSEVPKSLHRLLRAWFAAGFETGLYCGQAGKLPK